MLAPVFQSLPGASFIVNCALPVKELRACLAWRGASPRQRRHAARQVRRRVRLALYDLRQHGNDPLQAVSYRRRAVCAAARNFYDNALHDTIRVPACLQANRPKISAACNRVLVSHGQ